MQIKSKRRGDLRGKNLLGMFFLSLLVFSIFVGVIGFVSAADAGEAVSTLAGSFSNLFSKTGWTEGQLPSSVAKIFFFFIVTLIIFLVLNPIFQKNKGLMFILSLLIGFLSTAYITPDAVYSILISYTALGLTLNTLLPLATLFGLSYIAATAKEGKVQLIMLSWFAWTLFAVYSTYRFVYDWFWAKEGSGFMNGILLVTTIVAAGMAIFYKGIMKITTHMHIESSKEAAKETARRATDMMNILAESERKTAGEK